MEIGVVLLRSITVSHVELKLVSEAAERLGYNSLWVTEHIVVPTQIRSRHPYSPDGRPSFVLETEMRARLPRESQRRVHAARLPRRRSGTARQGAA